MTSSTVARSISEHELEHIDRANATMATPVVFVHGLWLLDTPGVTEIVKMENRVHALTIDHGWRDVAETALAFVRRFT
jgi:hypothetical protein